MTSIKGNVIVGQSGGPTAVINSSLAGVYKTAKDRGAKKVYGMLHGVQGLLQERYVDLSEHIRSDLDIDLFKADAVFLPGFLPFQTAGDQGEHGSLRQDLCDPGTNWKSSTSFT